MVNNMINFLYYITAITLIVAITITIILDIDSGFYLMPLIILFITLKILKR